MDKLPSSLKTALQEGAIIPFIGAGVSMAVRACSEKAGQGPALFPSWRELLSQAAQWLRNEQKDEFATLVDAYLGVTPPRYLDAAHEAQQALGPLWVRFLSATLDLARDSVDDESLELAQAIWSLNSKLVITTNYDRVLRWACPDSDNLTLWDIEAPAEFVNLLRSGLSRSTIWHLHGCIENPTGMILTPDGYSLLYVSDLGRQPQYEATLQTLRSLLISKTLLFIGFSFDDGYLGDQIRWLKTTFHGCAGPHYLLVRQTEQERLQDSLKNLPITLIPFADFGAPLVELVAELAKHTIADRPTCAEIISSAPPMRWRGGHFTEQPTPLMPFLVQRQLPLLSSLQDLANAVKDEMSDLNIEPLWIRHQEQVVTYLGELIPDEIKNKLSDFALSCLTVIGQRSLELALRRRKDVRWERLGDAARRALVGLDDLQGATDAVLDALLHNADVVLDHPATASRSEDLNFILGCSRFVQTLDLSFNRFPRETYQELSPHHRIAEEELDTNRFQVQKVELDYNLHEVAIHALCGSPELHQVLATLADYVGQSLIAVGPALDAKFISLLRIKLYVKADGYEGYHQDFRTQVSTVISMFMGEELYGDQQVFLRELLQNSRDAVLTRAEVEMELGNAYAPKVSIILDSKKQTLICKDNGIGMDRYTIERYLADIGRSFYTSDDYRNLISGVNSERFSPVSRFGIGILSCFMVASKMVIYTRQRNKPGYRIEVPARGAFFFLEEDPSITDVGTEVCLELKPDACSQYASWKKPFSSRRTNEIDFGVLVEINGILKPVLDDRNYKRYLVSSPCWRLPRLIAAYAVNLPFPVEVKEDGIRCVISEHRLIGKIQSDWKQHVVWRHGSPISTAILKSKNPELDRGRVRRRQQQTQPDMFRVLSSGGIYVANCRNFDLGTLGLPKWEAYIVDFAPERIRMNLARSTILNFDIRKAETTETWNSIEPQVIKLIQEMTTSNNRGEYQSRTEALYTLLTTLPKAAKSLVAQTLLNSYQVALFRFTKNGCEAWRSPLSDIAKSKVNQFILASENINERNLHFILDERRRPMEKEMAFVIDCHFDSAVKLAKLSFDEKIKANPFGEDGKELGGSKYTDLVIHSQGYFEARNKLKTSVRDFLESIAAVPKRGTWVDMKNTTVSQTLDQVRRAFAAMPARK
jgi:hypothetical protein